MREALFRMSGVDLTGIDAIGVETVQVVLSEYGPGFIPEYFSVIKKGEAKKKRTHDFERF